MPGIRKVCRGNTNVGNVRRAWLIRGAWCVAGLVAAGSVAWPWLWRADPVVAAAERLFGERWYAVVFRHTPIGHYRARNSRTAAGHFAFRSALAFRLRDGAETRMEDLLLFHKDPPHRLLRATHTVAGAAGRRRSVVIEDGVARVDEAGAQWRTSVRDLADAACGEELTGKAGVKPSPCATPDEFTLGQYLAVETWLAAGGAAVGERQRARSVDLDHLAYVWQHWRVARVADGQVEIARVGTRNTQPAAMGVAGGMKVGLDEHFAPVFVDLGWLVLRRVWDEDSARLWQRGRPLFADQTRGAAVDGLIRNPLAIRRLVLAVEAQGSARLEWLRRLDQQGSGRSRLLTLHADPRRAATVAETDSALAATANLPAHDPELRALAARAAGEAASAGSKADALVRFVHSFLRYEDGATPGGVIDAVRAGRGDCTEFADLYTTLARAGGLPARTVVGLAYRAAAPGEGGEFALHAWNEVAVDGVWRGVDPTWGRTRLAATHLPIPPQDLLAAAVALPDLTFRVVEAHY